MIWKKVTSDPNDDIDQRSKVPSSVFSLHFASKGITIRGSKGNPVVQVYSRSLKF